MKHAWQTIDVLRLHLVCGFVLEEVGYRLVLVYEWMAVLLD